MKHLRLNVVNLAIVLSLVGLVQSQPARAEFAGVISRPSSYYRRNKLRIRWRDLDANTRYLANFGVDTGWS